ncbi:MAG: glutamate--tRNA ligase, partial [Nitrososphaeraceae archaeon]
MLLDQRLRDSIKAATLQNALEHDGKAKADAVIGKIAASSTEFRSNLKSIVPAIKEVVLEINALPQDVQKLLLEQLGSAGSSQHTGLTEKSHVASSIPLPKLENATRGKVITRFPPEPSGYPHIGHAKAAIIDEYYARMYDGRFILRFDDTNPLNEKLEYYEAFTLALEWLNIRPDIIKNTSDDIELLYDYGRKLVLNGDAYVCTCNQQKIHDLRSKGIECDCRKRPTSDTRNIDNFFDGRFNQNEAIIRFKGSMADQNTAMRDPTLFRIIDGHHPKLGDKYRIWPTYDFAAPIEDSLDGVSHAFRTKEYELRNALYFAILERLGLRKPNMIEFSRLEFNGLPVSKRKIKPLIENDIIKSWDDPRLPTLAAMKRRGFIPGAIRRFVLSLGMTLAETKPPFESLEAFNRKLIEPESIRLFFVKDPVEIMIQNSSAREIRLKNHPNIDLGTRRIKVSDSIYISKEDAIRLRAGNEVRLIEMYNIRIVEIKTEGTKLTILASWSGDNIRPDIPKIQWVAKNDDRQFEILVPKELYLGDIYNVNSLEVWKGLA